MKGIKSHAGIFLQVKHRAFHMCVSERHSLLSKKNAVLIQNKRQKSVNISCRTVVHMLRAIGMEFLLSRIKIEYSTMVLKQKSTKKQSKGKQKAKLFRVIGFEP